MNNNYLQNELAFQFPKFNNDNLNDRGSEESYQFLLLTIYFYLKQNNYNTTAEFLFKETNLGKTFSFPQYLEEPKNEMDKLKTSFINYYYYNTFYKQGDTSDFLADNWNQFWDIFIEKIKQNNQNYSVMDQYLANHKINLTCK